MVDYRKWDKMKFESDSSDDEQPRDTRSRPAASPATPAPPVAVSPMRQLSLDIVADMTAAIKLLTSPEDADLRGRLAQGIARGHVLKLREPIKLSSCAADHLSVVRSLNAAQLAARYRLACHELDTKCGGANASTAPVASVELASALHSCKPCKQCRGSQYFSFCLNRVVNADRVQHCNDCGRCFYFRPGFARGCPYCAAGDDMDDEEKDWQALFGAAARGFWRSPTAPAGQQFFQAW